MSNEQHTGAEERDHSPPRGDIGFENQDRFYYAQNREIQNAFNQEGESRSQVPQLPNITDQPDHDTVLRLVNGALRDPFLPRFYRAKFEVSVHYEARTMA